MPSFDVVSELDSHELTNAVAQANKEVNTRFDFKGTDAKFELAQLIITLDAEADFQLVQMQDILRGKMIKRGIDVLCIKEEELQQSGKRVTQKLVLQEGIAADIAKKIVKFIKEKKLKVQLGIQGDKLRVTGKKRDDLQEVMQILKAEAWGIPLQFDNFRD